MKEYLGLLIEWKWRKWDEFDTFISAIYKLPSPNEKYIVLHQGNDFIDMYKTFFDKHYKQRIKDILPLSIAGTPDTSSTFAWWYLGVTETDKTESNIVMYEVHKCDVSTTIWRYFLDFLTINPKGFDGDPIVSQK